MAEQRFDAPFVGGMVPDRDVPKYGLGPNQTTYAQDLIATRNVARQRKGFEAYYSVGTAGHIEGVWKDDYVLANKENVLVASHSGTHGLYVNSNIGTNDVFTIGISYFDSGDLIGDGTGGGGFALSCLNSSGTGTVHEWPSGTLLPRTVYNDELICVYDDGVKPAWRYSGATHSSLLSQSGTPYLEGNASTVVGTWSATPDRSSYITIDNGTFAPVFDVRISEASSNEITLTDTLTDSGTLQIGTGSYFGKVASCGRITSSVPVYDEGVVTISGTVVTGNGSDWNTGTAAIYDYQEHDSILLFGNTVLGTSYQINIDSVDGANTIIADGPTVGTGIEYEILRSAPFTDVEVHKGSLFGSGVKQWPGRLWVGPIGWNLQTPPGFASPYNYDSNADSTNIFDFKMDYINVPDESDGDEIVAIISMGDYLGVLKQRSLHGVFGAYPQFSQQKIADGAGCLDKRSAWSLPAGPFWAGREGIFTVRGVSVVDITERMINRRWRNLVRGFNRANGDYCTLGQVFDHIIVNVSSDGSEATFVFDLQRKVWISEFSNFGSKFYFTTADEDLGEEVYFVPSGTATNQICRAAGAFFDDGTTPTDAIQPSTGFAPQMKAWTGNNLSGDIGRESRLRAIEVETNILTTTGTNTNLVVSHVGGGHYDDSTQATNETYVTGTIVGDTTDRIDHTNFRAVNYAGRTHQLRFEVGTIDADTADIEVASFACDFRMNRSR